MIILEHRKTAGDIKLPGTCKGKLRLYLSSKRPLMVRGQGSVAAPLVPMQRRSSRVNLGLNGRAVQLDRLGGQLVAPVRQKKRQFIPEDGVVLENNALAPVPKKRRSKVLSC